MSRRERGRPLDEEWIHPQRVASALGKNLKKTQLRFSNMADRGLLELNAKKQKLLFRPTDKTRALFGGLELYELSSEYAIDLDADTAHPSLPERFTIDELYAAQVDDGPDVAIHQINGVRAALKRGGFLEGDPLTGYTFTIG